VSTVFRLIQYREKVSNSIFIFRAISLTSVGKPPCFLHFLSCLHMAMSYQMFLRHLPNCPCSNFSWYVDFFQEISPRIAKQLCFQVKLHHLRRKCKNDNPGFFMNGIFAMKNPDALRILFPEFFGGKYKSLKKHNSRRIIS
jgi:hypothetical protein